MSDPHNRERLDQIYDELEASLEDMSAEEILEVIRARGKDPDHVVLDVQGLFADITKEHRQSKLREARAGLAESRKTYASRTTHIPADPGAQRALYYQVAQQHSQFTIQQRELEALPPEELLEILKQMDALGLLSDEES